MQIAVEGNFTLLCRMNKGWKCAPPATLYSVQYFLCELSLANSCENGHLCVIRDTAWKCRLRHMKAKFSPTSGKGYWIYVFNSFGFQCLFHHGTLVLFIWTPGLGTNPSAAFHSWGISVSCLLLCHMYWWWLQQCCPDYQELPKPPHRSCLCL